MFDYGERTLTGMTTSGVDLLSHTRGHRSCMSVAKIFVRFTAELALSGFSRNAHREKRTTLAVVCQGFVAAAFDFHSACADLCRSPEEKESLLP